MQLDRQSVEAAIGARRTQRGKLTEVQVETLKRLIENEEFDRMSDFDKQAMFDMHFVQEKKNLDQDHKEFPPQLLEL